MRALNIVVSIAFGFLLIYSAIHWLLAVATGSTADSALWCAAVLVFMREVRETIEELFA